MDARWGPDSKTRRARIPLTWPTSLHKPWLHLAAKSPLCYRLQPGRGRLTGAAAPAHFLARSSSGLGRRPLTPVTRVRIPYGLPSAPFHFAPATHTGFWDVALGTAAIALVTNPFPWATLTRFHLAGGRRTGAWDVTVAISSRLLWS